MPRPVRCAVFAITLVSAGVALMSAAAAQTTSAQRAQLSMVEAFSKAWAGISGYGATVTIFEQKDAQTQNVVFEYTFRKPSTMTVRVAAGPNAGVTLEWDGGSTMVARRGSGLMALFKKRISITDPLATTIRGSTLEQLSFGAILAHAQEAAGTVTQGHISDNGVLFDAITVVPTDPANDAGLTREIVELSPSTHLPTRVIGYQGATLVRSIEFTNVTLEH